MMKNLSLLFLTGLLCLFWGASAPAGDIHDLFEARCGGCHEHAGDLARDKLALDSAGQLVSKESQQPIEPFLKRHHGRQHQPEEVQALVALFTRQVQAGGIFKEKCRVCHDSGRSLATIWLIQDDSGLRGRYSGLATADFLADHGRTTETEREILLKTLKSMAPKRQ